MNPIKIDTEGWAEVNFSRFAGPGHVELKFHLLPSDIQELEDQIKEYRKAQDDIMAQWKKYADQFNGDTGTI